MNEISNLEKIDWVHWVFDELSNVDALKETWGEEINQARDFIEDIRELFIPDMK